MRKIGRRTNRKRTIARSVVLLTAAVTALSTTVGTGGAVGQAAPGPAEVVAQPVMPGAGVSAQVTKIVFATPQTLDELATQLAGTTVLQLRYTGDVTGMSQSGPGSSAHEAIAELRTDTVAEYQAPPLVFMAIVDGVVPVGAVDGAQVTTVASDSPDADSIPQGLLAQAAQATRDRQARLAAQGVAAPNPHLDQVVVPGDPSVLVKQFPWSPVQGQMQAWDTPRPPESDYPRKFRHDMTWFSQVDIDAFGDDFGYEHNMSLYNENDISGWTRPFCNPFDWDDPYDNFWAAWDQSSFKWNAVRWGSNVPGEAAPYFDWDDATDSCQKLDFSIGIGYPKRLQPQLGYSAWIHAQRGEQSSSPYDLSAQKLSNDCNDLFRDPGSSCMGLNFNRVGSGSEILVNKARGWTVSGCVNWNPNSDPIRLGNGAGGCPPNG